MTEEGGDVIADEPLTSDPSRASDQALRLRRLGMASASYLVSFTIVAICAWLELLSWQVAAAFLAFSLTILGAFLLVFRTGMNLRFSDPSLTAIQMVASMLPMLYVMFHLDSGQARAILLMTVIVPALYGMLALGSRQMIAVSGIFLALYATLISGLWLWRAEVMTPSLELIQAATFVLVVSQIAIIGGFVSDLRQKLKDRNAELNEALTKITDMANHDQLTGLSNRRHLFSILEQETSRYHRAHGPFSIGIIDLDHFKSVNDTYGHAIGDTVLCRVSETAAVSLRNVDALGRYGGEEFLLVMPQTSLEGAWITAERVRERIAALRYPEISENLRSTASIGIAEYRTGESIDETIHRADHALYRAKEDGRNRCRVEESA